MGRGRHLWSVERTGQDERDKRLGACRNHLVPHLLPVPRLLVLRINRFRSLRFIANYLVKRDHLTEKAALFLAKAYIVYKVSVVDLSCRGKGWAAYADAAHAMLTLAAAHTHFPTLPHTFSGEAGVRRQPHAPHQGPAVRHHRPDPLAGHAGAQPGGAVWR